MILMIKKEKNSLSHSRTSQDTIHKKDYISQNTHPAVPVRFDSGKPLYMLECT